MKIETIGRATVVRFDLADLVEIQETLIAAGVVEIVEAETNLQSEDDKPQS